MCVWVCACLCARVCECMWLCAYMWVSVQVCMWESEREKEKVRERAAQLESLSHQMKASEQLVKPDQATGFQISEFVAANEKMYRYSVLCLFQLGFVLWNKCTILIVAEVKNLQVPNSVTQFTFSCDVTNVKIFVMLFPSILRNSFVILRSWFLTV